MASVPGSFPGPGPTAPAAGAVSSLCFHDQDAYFNDMLTRGLSHLVPTHLQTAFGAYCHRFNAKSSVASSVLSDPGQLRHPSSPSDLSDLATLPSDHCRINPILVERKATQLAAQYRAYQEQQRREQRRPDEAQTALPGSHHVHSDHHLPDDDDRARCVSVPAVPPRWEYNPASSPFNPHATPRIPHSEPPPLFPRCPTPPGPVAHNAATTAILDVSGPPPLQPRARPESGLCSASLRRHAPPPTAPGPLPATQRTADAAERARDEERREIQAQYAAELSGYEQQLDRYKSLSQEAVSCKGAMEAARVRLLRLLARVDALDVESGDDDDGEQHRHDDDNKGGAPPRNTTDCASHVAVPQPQPRPRTPQTRADCAEEWRFDRLAPARRPRRRGQGGKNGREGKPGAPGGA
ncbi:hypothetical protein ColLi_12201 [Colletotrichum liriopes]|uniref:Uncharacterized protein n=1 Tax=Colletotrichum liriopes TaxID=708192 RepID=A0AA37H0I9_9PEZI|nr:hypothetical protein ColLi_12201 [Colletotrichum liriopes]